MSILPSQAQGTASSSSSQAPSQNPNPNHGNHPSLSPLQPPSPPHISFGSLHISDSHPPLSCPDQTTGPLASAAEEPFRSSEEVTDSGTSNGKRTSSQESRRNVTHSQSRGKMSGTTVSLQNQRGSGSHASTLHSAGRRAQMMNGNHLLNFHYDPIARSRPQQRAPPPRRQQKLKPYNKDLFLQANYRFVVLDTGNYTPESMDPDKMLKWEDIICLRYSTPFPVQCPICLDYPLCPQITSCGHIFCFPCILQYLLMGKDNHKEDCYKRCPLCFVMVSAKDLYTIYIENVKQYNVGDTIDFMLLTRRKDSFALSQKDEKETGTMPCCKHEVDDPFAKFTFTSDVELSVRRAISDLDSWLVRADSGLVDDLEKLPYVCAAMEQLEQRKKYWNEHRACNSNKTSKNNECKTGYSGVLLTANASCANGGKRDLGQRTLSIDADDQNGFLSNLTKDKSNRETGLDQSADEGESFKVQDGILSSSHDEKDNLRQHSSDSKDAKNNDTYNFYQAVDGQHIILHPLNMKCLLHHFGSYDLLPNRVNGRILELETVTQSEAIRRRYRYLSHFSLTTTFQFCEIDMSGELPPDALLPFMDEIKKREKQRKQLARKERQENIKAEVAAAAAAAAQFTPIVSNFGQSSHDHSPTFSMDDFEALGGSPVVSSSHPVAGERKLWSSVTRLGFAAGHDSPSLKIEEANPDHNSEVASDSATVKASRNSGTLSFANMISRAKSVENLDAPKMNETGKKGKKPSRVLLSTTGGRRY